MKNDVITIGSKEVESKKDLQEVDTQKIAEQIIKKKFRTQFLQVYKEIQKNKTLDQIFDEVKNKKSTLTLSAREFVLNFTKEIIEKWINDEEC